MITVGAGRYRLDRRIAAGGMGEVWLGTDTSLGRQVAVKLLHHSLSDDDTFRARFQAEARHAAALHDPHIATVFDYGDELDEHDAHRSYLVMEYVDGQPLSALLRGPLPADQTAHLLAQAADALAVAHDAGIVHRDVKPANFLVTPDRRVKITDFGVARARGVSSLTDTGTIIGTPSYVAPEVAEGRDATPASDIYSLGVVLYECLAGRRPFIGGTPVAVAIAHLREEPPPLPAHVSEPMRDLVSRSLAKDPAARPVSAAVFAAQLRQAAAGSGATPPGPVPPATVPMPVAPVPGPVTSVLPAAGATSTPPPEERRSRGIAWPLLAVAAAIVLIVALAVAISALTGDPDTTAGNGETPRVGKNLGGPTGGAGTTDTSPPPEVTTQADTTAPETTTPETTTAESTPPEETSTAPEEETAFVDAEEYIGDKAPDVEKALRDLDLVPVRADEEGDGERGTVADVEPTGEVPVGSEVTVYVWKETGSDSGEGPKDDDDDD